MNWVIKLMNIAAPIATLALLSFIFPLYFALDLLRSITKRFLSENVAGKVILITGASSGIGESLAYEYAKRGARLALAARIEDRLQLEVVAKNAKKFGSPDSLTICVDVSKPHDCSNLIDQTVLRFGQLDHLINNAGIVQVSMFQNINDVSNYASIMDVNFWGSVHCTHSAIPHLRKTKGKIVVISSIASWLPMPKVSFYNASKAALTSFFETLRVEFGSNIGITIVTPGVIRTKMVTDEYLKEFGYDKRLVESSEVCAKAIVESACRGDRYLTVPAFYKPTILLKLLASELQEWFLRYFLIHEGTSFKKHA